MRILHTLKDMKLVTDVKLKHFCYVVVLAMILHLTDVQQEHLTSTRGEAVAVTAR